MQFKKSGKEPKAGVELVLGETTSKTKVRLLIPSTLSAWNDTYLSSNVFVIIPQLCDRSASPKWNESFYFIIHDPKRQMLVAKARRFLYGVV